MTMRSRRTPATAGALILLLPVLALAGCGPKEDEATPTASGAATPQTIPSLPPEVQVGPPQ